MIFLRYWKPLSFALALAFALVAGFSYMKGRQHEQASWEAAKVKQIERQLKINSEVSNEYQKKVSGLRKRHDDFVRLHLDSLRIRAASGCDAAPGTNGLHGGIREIHRLMMQADLQTQQLIALQGWINKMR